RRKDSIIFDVSSTTKIGTTYIIDSTIRICLYFVGILGASYKHQAAIAIKFQERTSNFVNTFTINERIDYFYIVTSNFTKDDNSNEELSTNTNKESNINSDKESDRYHNTKNLSENKLVSFVYQHASSSVTIRSGKKIPVQVTLVQRRKETTRR
ncbi:8522_t:CDS:2, partial [Scutellospora calospora]